MAYSYIKISRPLLIAWLGIGLGLLWLAGLAGCDASDTTPSAVSRSASTARAERSGRTLLAMSPELAPNTPLAGSRGQSPAYRIARQSTQIAWIDLGETPVVAVATSNASVSTPTTVSTISTQTPNQATVIGVTATPTATMPVTAATTGRAVATTLLSPTSTPPRRGAGSANLRIVALDPGHGGPEGNAVHRDANGEIDLVEKEANLSVSLILARMLREAGYQVVLTRETDTLVAPPATGGDFIERTRIEQQARIDIANAAAADILISIHHNGFGDPAVRGTETYYCSERPFAENSRKLAALVLEGLAYRFAEAGYETYIRGIKDDASIGARYGQPHSFLLGTNPGIRPSRMPGIFGEALFISNHEEAALLQRQDIREAEARGYFDAIQAYFAWLDNPQ